MRTLQQVWSGTTEKDLTIKMNIAFALLGAATLILIIGFALISAVKH